MIVGLTGGIASGKSTISEMIQEMNIPVIDADKIAREVVLPGEPAYKQIVEFFGTEILEKDGNLHRKKLGSIIFNDEEKRLKLNSIVHPAVRKRMIGHREELLEEHEDVVMDIPLLFESKLTHMVDRTLLVYVDKETQLRRLMDRDHSSAEESLSRIRSQIPLDDKKKWADDVIDNNGTFEESRQQLIHIFTKWDIL
ncbi:dephospho-CoA kinase [Bacillus sp. Marseille-Q3570]|uniref:dephospho-CoA kinase n=1 Tax=Bacillus sp. Marseille-Q3570 TaxID=2963522 RepID=UPI0028DBEF55|nr:dephospho-CoA kinase [Bacillus sp. Marseille-Q3570]